LTRFPAEGVSSIKGQFSEFESGRFAEVMLISHYGKITAWIRRPSATPPATPKDVRLLQWSHVTADPVVFV
jgi:hypothetical protein